jgi:hypothetical protein
MKTIFKNSLYGLAVGATALAATTAAEAHPDRYHHEHTYVKRDNDALVAGIAGLAVGAIAGSMLAQQRPAQPRYIDPPVSDYDRYETGYRRYEYRPAYRNHDYYPPARSYRVREVRDVRDPSYEPWTREWFRACEARYRSFNPRTGTYTTYGGEKRFCQP